MQNDRIAVGSGHRVVKIKQLRECWPSCRVYLVASEWCAIEEIELDSLLKIVTKMHILKSHASRRNLR